MWVSDSIHLAKQRIAEDKSLVRLTLDRLGEVRKYQLNGVMKTSTIESLWRNKVMLDNDSLKLSLPGFIDLVNEVDATLLSKIKEQSLKNSLSEEEILERLNFISEVIEKGTVLKCSNLKKEDVLKLRKELVANVFPRLQAKGISANKEIEILEFLQSNLSPEDLLFKEIGVRGNLLLEKRNK